MKKQMQVVAAVALAVGSSVHAQQAVQWRVEDGGNGHWYAAIRPDPMPFDFTSQDAAASRLGAHMATLKSFEENQFAIGLLSGLPGEENGAYLGLRRVGSAWRWIDDEAVGWSAWGGSACASGPYPNNSVLPGEMSGHLYLQNCGWIWDDTPPGWFVSSSGLRLIVEWDADCNHDGIVDYGQILDGTLVDANHNGIPDCCENGGSCCIGDILVDRIINGADLGALLSYWGPVTSSQVSRACDLNGDGRVDGPDLAMLLANWGTCP